MRRAPIYLRATDLRTRVEAVVFPDLYDAWQRSICCMTFFTDPPDALDFYDARESVRRCWRELDRSVAHLLRRRATEQVGTLADSADPELRELALRLAERIPVRKPPRPRSTP